MKHLKSFNEKFNDQSLYRLINRQYSIFIQNFFDNKDDDRSGSNNPELDDFIQDCIDLFGQNGVDDFNSGYSSTEIEECCQEVWNQNYK